jgi:hypothetical protein
MYYYQKDVHASISVRITEEQIYQYCLVKNKPYFGTYKAAIQCPSQRATVMFTLAKAKVSECNGPVNFMEIGSWAGGSAIIWAEAIKCHRICMDGGNRLSSV